MITISRYNKQGRGYKEGAEMIKKVIPRYNSVYKYKPPCESHNRYEHFMKVLVVENFKLVDAIVTNLKEKNNQFEMFGQTIYHFDPTNDARM